MSSGHYVASLFHRVDSSLPYFLPSPFLGTFGAFIRIRSPIFSRRALFDIGIAGPLAGFIFLVPALAVGIAFSKVIPGIGHQGTWQFGVPALQWLLESAIFPGTASRDIYLHPVARAAWVGMFATAMNLLPIGQLDGGHILYSFFPARHRVVSRAICLLMLPLGIFWNAWFVWAVDPVVAGPPPSGDLRFHRTRRSADQTGLAGARHLHSLLHLSTIRRRRTLMKITATIITLNEERNIARAIESLRCCDEILILDSGSTDRTVELAGNLGARVIEAGWRGYAGQKNWAAEQATHDWILSLDADEALSEALEAEILNLKKSGPRFDAYTMPRLARYLGRWIYHSGWYPDRKIRLYDRRRAKWVGDFVHESVRCKGHVGNLESNILHFTCDSLSEHVKTLDRYTTLAAQELAAGKVPVPMWSLIVDPPWNFVKAYIIQRGFLDGLEGLIISYMAAFYTFLKYSKARNMS